MLLYSYLKIITSSFFSGAKKKSPASAGPSLKRTSSSSEERESPVKKPNTVDIEDEELEELKTEQQSAKLFIESIKSSQPPLSHSNISDNDKLLRYKELVEMFDALSATNSRLQMIKIASDFFYQRLKTFPDELSKVTYLCVNRLGPDYEGLELGLGESLIQKALSEATGKPLAQIKKEYQQEGDLGKVALLARGHQPTMFPPKPLTVNEVFKSFTEIAKISGTSAQRRRIDIVKRLLTACKGNEAKYLVRSLCGNLRIGMAEKSLLSALAQAFVAWEYSELKNRLPPEKALVDGEEVFKEVYSQMPNYELVIQAALKHGPSKIAEFCKITAGLPVKPMLAKPTKSITEILDRFHEVKFTCEYKYDGERAQVHATEDGQIHIYSRNMEDMTQRYPDLATVMPRFLNKENKSFILDCEAVAWDRETKKILPFQVLSSRKRKDVEEGSIKVRICLFAFDMLFFNGESLLKKPFSERRFLLHENFPEVEGEFQYAQSMDTDNVDEIQTFLDQSVKDNCEGLMIKVLKSDESYYEPSKRSRNWLKLKKDYLDGVGDSLDLVVLGAYYGRGKRTKFYGGYLLGCYNPDSEEYEIVCKIGTGFSDEQLEEFYNDLSKTAIDQPKSYFSITPSVKPDVWFEPTKVWEIKTADLTLSPIYTAGAKTMGEKGISLRFPRFIRVRDDKSPENSTNSEQIVDMYNSQRSMIE